MIKHSLILASLVTTGLAFTSSARADVKCSPDVEVDYKSGQGSSIKVVKLEYMLDNTSVVHSEGVSDKVIDKSKDHTFKSQRLGSVAKGQKIKVRAVFKADTGNDYGPEKKSSWSSERACENAGVTYKISVD
ncbi:MAG: hypothetical protein ABI867_19060 [Kofleriaceae bacterium]